MEYGRRLGQMNTEPRPLGSHRKFAVFVAVMDEAIREPPDRFERRTMHNERARCERPPGECAIRLFAPEISKVLGNIEEVCREGPAGSRRMDHVRHDDRPVIPGDVSQEVAERVFRKLNVRVKEQHFVRRGQSHAGIAAGRLVTLRNKTIGEIKWPFIRLEPESVQAPLVFYRDDLNFRVIDRLSRNRRQEPVELAGARIHRDDDGE